MTAAAKPGVPVARKRVAGFFQSSLEATSQRRPLDIRWGTGVIVQI